MNSDKDVELSRIRKEKIEELIKKSEGSECPDSPIDLSSDKFRSVLEEYPLVVVDFWAEWCGACMSLSPILEDLAKKYSGQVVFGKVNIDQNSGLAQKFQITGIPTLLFVKDGDFVDKIVGLVSRVDLEQKLKAHLS